MPTKQTISAMTDAEVETVSALATSTENAAKTSQKGHGRNGADAYIGAEKIVVSHESLQPGDPCPKCEQGTVYETARRVGATRGATTSASVH